MFHFTIRDLLWLTALVAVLAAWSIDHAKTRIDWQLVRENERQLELAKKEVFWSQQRVKMAREQKVSVLRAAAQRGITTLDIAPETVIPRQPLDE